MRRVYNASDSSVSVVSLSGGSLALQATIALDDPTPSEIAAGRHLLSQQRRRALAHFHVRVVISMAIPIGCFGY